MDLSKPYARPTCIVKSFARNFSQGIVNKEFGVGCPIPNLSFRCLARVDWAKKIQ